MESFYTKQKIEKKIIRKIMHLVLMLTFILLSCCLFACGHSDSENNGHHAGHTHAFNRQIAESKYLKSAVTCMQKATYYYSCECGEKGTETFEYGEIQHTPKEAVKENEVSPTYEAQGGYDSVVRCSVCGVVLSSEYVTIDKISLFGTEIYSKTLTVDGDRLFATLPNGTDLFRFAGDITVADGATYYLCADIYGSQVIPTKIAQLDTGDNIFYLVVENGSADPMTYTVMLRVRPMYTVTFDTDGGNSVASQSIEEDRAINDEPTTAKTGYTLAYWTESGNRVMFPYTVTQDTVFIAAYTANEYTASLDVNGGNEFAQSEYSVTYDNDFTFLIPTRTGYTFLGWYDEEEMVTDSNGYLSAWKFVQDKQLTAKWEANIYTITAVSNKISAGMITGTGNYEYGTTVTLLVQETYLGYSWMGWYDGDELLSSDMRCDIVIGTTDKTYTATWEVRDAMKKFSFNSTATTCTITKVTDINLETIIIPDYVTTIGSSAFSYCRNLKSIIIPNSVTDIKDHAFEYCSSLANIEIGNSVTSIGGVAFGGCSSLTNVTIPNSVRDIGFYAFRNCGKLTSVTFMNPNGWSIKLTEGWARPNSSSLANAFTAAEYLTSTYLGYAWSR